mmetsp:Transcript_101231/g.151658  ORF Transcript_101231/g.151658 Transcript_101231/m.151658 type:complete len:218 (+) Transcript_101231:233-886(+)
MRFDQRPDVIFLKIRPDGSKYGRPVRNGFRTTYLDLLLYFRQQIVQLVNVFVPKSQFLSYATPLDARQVRHALHPQQTIRNDFDQIVVMPQRRLEPSNLEYLSTIAIPKLDVISLGDPIARRQYHTVDEHGRQILRRQSHHQRTGTSKREYAGNANSHVDVQDVQQEKARTGHDDAVNDAIDRGGTAQGTAGAARNGATQEISFQDAQTLGGPTNVQ